MATPMEDGSSAEEFKNQGNDAFKANNFKEALELYSKAIGECSSTDLSPVKLLNFIRTF
jgi:hypothetical protein